MNANDLRLLATEEFMTNGLGGILTHRAGMLIEAQSQGGLDFLGPIATQLVFGNIIERTLWIALGRWIGYLQPVPSISRAERQFLVKHAGRFKANEWPTLFASVMETLLSEDTDRLTFGDPLITSALPQNDRAIFPLFQAASLLAETLTDGPIEAFFIFLGTGDPEVFRAGPPTPNAVYRYLEFQDHAQSFLHGFWPPEAVIAGFMRYSEFLAAMNDLFPFITETQFGNTSAPIPERTLRREQLAVELGAVTQWKFPRDGMVIERYNAAQFAFFQLVDNEIESHLPSGLQWSREYFHSWLNFLTSRFFQIQVWRDGPRSAVEEPLSTAYGPSKRFREFTFEEAEQTRQERSQSGEDDELTHGSSS